MNGRTNALLDAIAQVATVQEPGRENYEPLLRRIGDARIVLLGEASHGTHDFYRMRAEITRHLIREKGFCAVAVEADWPDALRVNRYVRGWPPGHQRVKSGGALRALESFTRFPSWMWRNREVMEFVEWLRSKNDSLRSRGEEIGFYGLDLYASTNGNDVEDVFAHERRFSEPRSGSVDAVHPEHVFYLEQTARLVHNAAEYFEAVCRGQELSWNLRERHMADTLDALLRYLDGTRAAAGRGPAKIAVWVHNSHAGDARATQMSSHGEVSLGQLMRERYGDQTALVGFTTFTGRVLAARAWGEPVEEMAIVHAHPESFEALFHQLGLPRFSIDFNAPLAGAGAATLRQLFEPRLERAIGAVYLPAAELENHYFYAELPRQFDYLFHLDETKPLGALDAVLGRAPLRRRTGSAG